VARLKRLRGLDQPWYVQYVRWFYGYHEAKLAPVYTGATHNVSIIDQPWILDLAGTIVDPDSPEPPELKVVGRGITLEGRKVLLGTRGKCVRDFSATMLRFSARRLFAGGALGKMARTLATRALQWNVMTTRIMLRARSDRELVGSASVDYLMYSGYVMMAYFWAVQAARAAELCASGKGPESADFYRSKIHTAEFYFERLLPRADGHRKGALAPTRSVMQLDKEHFAFN
jgi:hypothetical protein